MSRATDGLLARAAERLGTGAVIAEPGDMEPYLTERRGTYHGKAAAILRPADTQGVAEAVRLCTEAGIAIVPMGGNTGLVGGAVAEDAERQIVLSTERLTAVREIDAANNTMTVEAGVILADAQAAAREAGRLFPLSLAAEGSCRIGGNLSTNAGGVHVLRYGNARELVLGLEVVLPDGRVWDGLKGLRKNNTGYDLKQLFLGAEGTLGIITAAVLKLSALPERSVTVFAGLPSPTDALSLLTRTRAALGERVSAFEIVSRRSLEFALRHVERVRDPLSDSHPWYVLIEAASSRADAGLEEAAEAALAEALEAEEVADAAVAQSEGQAADFWHLREAISDAQKPEGASLKHDISVPVSALPAFIDRTVAACQARLPGIRPVIFGHLGDGNLHFNLSQPKGMAPDDFFALREAFSALVHDNVEAMGGSISAEHGIGIMKRDEMAARKQAVEMDLMRAVKRAIDPDNRMNPGKVIALDRGAKEP